MKIEQDRGISVATSRHDLRARRPGLQPARHAGPRGFLRGHLPHPDRGRRRGDGARRRQGHRGQTRKLFEVCRLRDIPIVTFVNKMDREARDPFELIDEIEKTLALDAAPVAWPVGRAADFAGTYDLLANRFLPVDATTSRPSPSSRPRRPAPRRRWSAPSAPPRCREEALLAEAACPAFDLERFREGTLTPVFFGSRAARLRRRPPAGRPRPLRPAAAARAPPTRAPSQPGEERADRLRLQGPGQHGPQPPRPRRLRAAVLRPADQGHAAAARCAPASRCR